MQCDPSQLPSVSCVVWLPGETTGVFVWLRFLSIVLFGHSGGSQLKEILSPAELGSCPSTDDGWPLGCSGSSLQVVRHSS